ncbi:hypothetical protein OVA13_17375 [Pseudoxanthomonas sp. SL93]|uniref:hypothetical protein n=1 Tax=Pseudoxanthomonas sp. SL93 TaxID=2995142 RepID=UPI00226F6DC7|nr:hypothetical protein [Pseudoxanthomonas sp. SL93]WAC63119.1 hypothetical protein OVA13_17375 [Pseudoxanthomonas sp. SL93]
MPLAEIRAQGEWRRRASPRASKVTPHGADVSLVASLRCVGTPRSAADDAFGGEKFLRKSTHSGLCDAKSGTPCESFF